MRRAARWIRGKALFVGLATTLALLAAACGGGADDGQNATPTQPIDQAGRQITVETTQDLTFAPAETDVSAGETVEFVVTDTSGFFHTFTIATGSDKQSLLADIEINGNETKSVSVVFPEESGPLYLYCKPHEGAGMTGEIDVQPGAA